jgi:hypothetical protein
LTSSTGAVRIAVAIWAGQSNAKNTSEPRAARPALVMLFYEPLFLFGFFPSVFAVFVTLRRFAKGSLTWIALASAAFYFWAEPKFFFLAIVSSALDFYLGKRIATNNRSALYLGVSTNVLLLIVFKYSSFLISQIADPILAGFGLPTRSLPATSDRHIVHRL